jgi:CRP/FNR family transcriptional regulator, cyclic AMP receptor protein
MPTEMKYGGEDNNPIRDWFSMRLDLASQKKFDACKLELSYPAGARVFQEAGHVRGIFILVKGAVRISVSSGKGKVLNLRLVRPGEIIMLSTIFSDHPYAVSATTMWPCQMIFLKRRDFLHLFESDLHIYLDILQQLAGECRSVFEQIGMIALSSSVPARLARLLLQWSDHHGPDRLPLGVTHNQMANFIGSSRETVSRVLIVRLPNRAALVSLAAT